MLDVTTLSEDLQQRRHSVFNSIKELMANDHDKAVITKYMSLIDELDRIESAEISKVVYGAGDDKRV